MEELLIPEPGKIPRPGGEQDGKPAAAPRKPGRPSLPGAGTGARCRPPDGRADPGRHPDRQLPGLPVLGSLLRLAVVLPGLL